MKDLAVGVIVIGIVAIALAFAGIGWAQPIADVFWGLLNGVGDVGKAFAKGIIEAIAGLARQW
jgi:hypothetical protein